MSEAITFTVLGDPAPAGSKRPGVNPQTGRLVAWDSSGKRGKVWRKLVRQEAQRHAPPQPLEGPLVVSMIFYRRRPKSHFGTGRNANVLKPTAPMLPVQRPDALKLARAVEDALSGVIYADDAQIIDGRQIKLYGTPGVRVSVTPIDSADAALGIVLEEAA